MLLVIRKISRSLLLLVQIILLGYFSSVASAAEIPSVLNKHNNPSPPNNNFPNNSSIAHKNEVAPSASNLIDLDEIIKRGALKVIVPSNLSGGLFLPRSDSPINEQLALAKKFAQSLNIELEQVPILSFKNMLPALNEGRGDLILANMTVTEERKKKLAFSIAVTHANEVLLVRKDDDSIKITKDLVNKNLILNKATSFWKTGEDFKKRYPEINLISQPASLFDEEILDLIANKKYDATIRDSNVAEMYLNYRDDLKVAFKTSSEKPIAWGMRLGSTQLKTTIDHFLAQEKLATHHAQKQFGDLEEIKKRGVLRILLKNNASSYFLKRGQLMGFEYEMAQAFAKHLSVRLVVLVPPSGDLTLDWLENGKVDIAAGFLSPSPQWKKRGIASSIPYHQIFQHIIVAKNYPLGSSQSTSTNTSFKKLLSVADLDGKTVVIHKSSRYWQDLEKLTNVGIKVNLQAAPENLEEEEIIEKVANGEYPMTLVDGHILNIELANHVAVKSAFTLGDQKDHTLAIRGEDSSLLNALNQYIQSKKDGKMYARLYAKYFTDNHQIRKHQRARLKTIDGKKMISQYDPLVQQYSKKYGFDWRFITAQMFQESRFDPDAKSHAGAIGLMQIMPSTAKQLGVSGIKNPTVNIRAGTKYMNWLYAKFEPELPVTDRMWFTLASYNAGLGHVLDARRLAKQQGLNKDRWFGNVEKAMLLLAKSKYAKKARYGYVRGREPVGYVRTIMRLYASYINIIELDNNLSQLPTSALSLAAANDATSFNSQLDNLYTDLYPDVENHPACCR